jgi:hypothetical protein
MLLIMLFLLGMLFLSLSGAELAIPRRRTGLFLASHQPCLEQPSARRPAVCFFRSACFATTATPSS